MNDRFLRFGEFIKKKRLADSRELTLKDVADRLGISLTLLSDIEQGRRKPFGSDKIEMFCKYLGLSEEELELMYDLAAKETRGIPLDIDETLMYTDSGNIARRLLRMTNAGIIKEDDWREFIRQAEEKKRGRGN